MDFTQMPVSQGYKYTFTGWIEGFPTRTEKAEEVVKKLIHEIIPKFGLPRSLQSDNGTSFTSKVTQARKHWALLIISIVPGGLNLQEKYKEPINS